MQRHRSRHVDAGGINIWVEEWGDPQGIPVFLCQRMGAQTFEWEPSMVTALGFDPTGGSPSRVASRHWTFIQRTSVLGTGDVRRTCSNTAFSIVLLSSATPPSRH